MSETPQKSGFTSVFTGVFKWIFGLPIIRDVVGFFYDIYKHYELDPVVSAGVSSSKLVVNDYQKSSGWFKFGLPLALVVVGFAVLGAIAYHAYFDPVVIRLVHLPLPVDAVRVKAVDITDVAGGGGQVQQSVTVTLTSRITGNVTKVPVNLGDIVTPDSVLFEADPRPFQAALTAAEQALAQAQSAEKMAEKQDLGYQLLKKEGLASEQDLLQSASVLATSKSKVADCQENLINAQLDLQSTVTKSPVTGIVLQRLINADERIIPAQTTFQLGDLKNIYFLALIGEDKVGFVRAGLKADVVFPAFPGITYHGDVFFVDPNTNPTTRSFTAYIKCENPNILLKPGLSGFARITQKRHFLAVPNSALINPVGENASVFVISDDNHAFLRKIHFGSVDNGYTEITDGLKEGELVAVVGPLYLVDGDRVHCRITSN